MAVRQSFGKLRSGSDLGIPINEGKLWLLGMLFVSQLTLAQPLNEHRLCRNGQQHRFRPPVLILLC